MIEIDGSYGEGGGAILRQALGMAVYAGEPVRVYNIRAGRTRPGLAPQHQRAVEAVGMVCGARVRGATLGSTEITFEPGPPKSGSFRFDIGTAGSTTLLLQALLLPCLCRSGDYEFRLTGGTDVPWSPPADYLSRVTLSALRGVGEAELSVRRRGYYPKGGGRLLARLSGASDPGMRLEFLRPGTVTAIRGVSHAAGVLKERRVAERQADAADHLLTRLGHPVEIAVEYSNAANPGSGITLWTESEGGAPLGGSALGVRGKAADEVGREAAHALLSAMDSGAAVDRYLADQLIPFLAVRGGSLQAPEVTPHMRSNIYVAEAVLGVSFEIEGTTITACR
jgi:RNA 3'-terminal phosphate cyclase (GTP)